MRSGSASRCPLPRIALGTRWRPPRERRGALRIILTPLRPSGREGGVPWSRSSVGKRCGPESQETRWVGFFSSTSATSWLAVTRWAARISTCSPHPRRAHHPRRCRGQTRPTRSPPAPRAPEAPARHRPARPSLRRLTDSLVVSLRRHALGTSVSWGLERRLYAPRPPPHTASPPRPPPPRLLPLTPVSWVVPPVRLL
jgi:hypothetical protein